MASQEASSQMSWFGPPSQSQSQDDKNGAVSQDFPALPPHSAFFSLSQESPPNPTPTPTPPPSGVGVEAFGDPRPSQAPAIPRGAAAAFEKGRAVDEAAAREPGSSPPSAVAPAAAGDERTPMCYSCHGGGPAE